MDRNIISTQSDTNNHNVYSEFSLQYATQHVLADNATHKTSEEQSSPVRVCLSKGTSSGKHVPQFAFVGHSSRFTGSFWRVVVCHSRLHIGQGPCRANMNKWSLASSPLCDCGEQQTMEHIVDSCPLTKLDGGLLSLHEADDDATNWLKTMATKAVTK